MKKIFYCLPLIASIFVVGCDQEEFLTKENLYQKNTETYYSTPEEVNEALTGVYWPLLEGGVSTVADEPVFMNIMSDNLTGGAGVGEDAEHRDNFLNKTEDFSIAFYTESYKGITRANFIIENVPGKSFDKAFKDQAVGEAYFMRGFYTFRLAKYYGGVPLITSTTGDRTVPRSSYTETYAQIAADFKMAADLMPATSAPTIPISSYGHANKWVAEAYLARAYLYYTGYMTNIEKQPTTTLPVAGGAALTKADVLVYLNDCVDKSGYALASDFRNLWAYSYVNIRAKESGSVDGDNTYPWAKTEGLSWVGQDGANPTFGTGNLETMFSIRYSNSKYYKMGEQYKNGPCLYWGIRDNWNNVPFTGGWGMCRVSPLLYQAYEAKDVRRDGSILNVTAPNPAEGVLSYVAASQNQDTKLIPKKYIGLQFKDKSSALKMMWFDMYPFESNNQQLDHAQDYMLLRFADVLLMHSELTETATGINLVRARAGVDPVPSYSLDALKKERMLELEMEGLRYCDLVRWGDCETAFAAAQFTVVNNGGKSGDQPYQVKYRPETKGLFPYPEKEVRLSNGSYKQNPGW